MSNKIIKKQYSVYERQDAKLQEWANKIPDLDKSGVTRIVLELGLAEFAQSSLTRHLIDGTIAVLSEKAGRKK